MTRPDESDSKIAKFPNAEEREVLEKARLMRHKRNPPEEPVLDLPPVVKTLILINVFVFLLTDFFPNIMTPERLYALSFVPARYFGTEPLGLAGIFSPVTHMFIHAGWLHLGINVGTLMAFGAGLEKKMGGRRLLLLYFISGLCGALFHALLNHDALVPMVGASGAISGLFGGILMMMHEDGMMGKGYRSLLPFIAIWIGVSVFFGFFGMPGTDNPIAWTTHVGGFLAGLLLYRPVSRMKI